MKLEFLILYFLVTGIFGWLYETFVMTMYAGKWDNRGFLYGPILPIYSIGCIAITYVISTYFPDATRTKIFLIGAVGSAVLEFSTSFILEKIFKKVWWDYSISPFNVQGRICLPASCGFGIAAVLVIKLFNPIVLGFLYRVPAKMAVALAALTVLLVIGDIIYTVKTLKFGFKGFEAYDRINDRMDSFVDEHYPFETTICEIVHERLENK